MSRRGGRPWTPPTTWRQVAQRQWRDAAWIAGNARFAMVAPCGQVSISLWPTMAAARQKWQDLSQGDCGAHCDPHQHFVLDLATRPGGLALAVRDAKRRLRTFHRARRRGLPLPGHSESCDSPCCIVPERAESILSRPRFHGP